MKLWLKYRTLWKYVLYFSGYFIYGELRDFHIEKWDAPCVEKKLSVPLKTFLFLTYSVHRYYINSFYDFRIIFRAIYSASKSDGEDFLENYLRDHIRNDEIRATTKVTNIPRKIATMKWQCTVHFSSRVQRDGATIWINSRRRDGYGCHKTVLFSETWQSSMSSRCLSADYWPEV